MAIYTDCESCDNENILLNNTLQYDCIHCGKSQDVPQYLLYR